MTIKPVGNTWQIQRRTFRLIKVVGYRDELRAGQVIRVRLSLFRSPGTSARDPSFL